MARRSHPVPSPPSESPAQTWSLRAETLLTSSRPYILTCTPFSVSALGLYLRPILAKEGETQKKRMKVKRDGGIIRKRLKSGMCSKKREKEQLVGRVDAEKSHYFEPIKRLRKSQHEGVEEQ